ncbi:Thiamine phosphate phosphatase-like protein [Bienertia sinuspersici]
MILNHIQSLAGEYGNNRTIYIGDGGGDYCPCLKLGENDHVMPRKKFPLWERIHSNPSIVKATVNEWSNEGELETTLLHLISAFDGNHLTYASTETNLTSKVHSRPASTVEVNQSL